VRYSRLSCVGSITSSYTLSPHKKSIGWADGVEITSRRYYGRRKPLFSFFPFLKFKHGNGRIDFLDPSITNPNFFRLTSHDP